MISEKTRTGGIKIRQIILLFLLLSLLFSGCGTVPQEVSTVQVVLEAGEGFIAADYVCTVPRGGDAVFSVAPSTGYAVTGTDYEGAVLSDGILTVPAVRYNIVVSLRTEKGVSIFYNANGGRRLDGGDALESVEVPTLNTHLRLNTSIGVDLFCRDGFTLTGWNTEPDGSGETVGLGSRVDWQEGLTLYAQWTQWTPATAFTWEPEGDGVRITYCTADEETLVVPGTLDGLPVYTIGQDACAGGAYTRLILPRGLRRVEKGAFADSEVCEVWLSDDIESVTDYAFTGCGNLQSLHINAAEPPVYSGNYFATFADKFDRLLYLSDRKKLVLFSGSSTRFGYDCAFMDQSLPDYEIINMGVFAYTSATPQLYLILGCMKEGDILLHAPEFDAAQRQFCTRSDLEDSFFCMMEANYDMVSRLDLRECTSVFTGLTAYLSAKAGMEPKDYSLSPSIFDEDGNPVAEPSYNEYGDYCLYRANADDDQPIYGLPVDYTVRSFPKTQFIEPLNAVYQRFLDRGIRVYFTYAPRNQYAISADSTPDARAKLDAWFRENLTVPVISDLEESLYPGRFLYSTDNHLSTEGVAIRTHRILEDLERQWRMEEDYE